MSSVVHVSAVNDRELPESQRMTPEQQAAYESFVSLDGPDRVQRMSGSERAQYAAYVDAFLSYSREYD